MDASRVTLGRKEERKGSGYGYAGVCHADEHLAAGSKRFRHEDGRGLAPFGGGKVGGVLSESKFARPGMIGRREAGEQNRAVADHLALEFFGQLRCGKGHINSLVAV